MKLRKVNFESKQRLENILHCEDELGRQKHLNKETTSDTCSWTFAEFRLHKQWPRIQAGH